MERTGKTEATPSEMMSPSHPEHDLSVMNNWFDLFRNNRLWAASTEKKDPEYFQRLAAAQVYSNVHD
jgi:hypothetical protein